MRHKRGLIYLVELKILWKEIFLLQEVQFLNWLCKPTFTIVQLSIRLAEHLSKKLSS